MMDARGSEAVTPIDDDAWVYTTESARLPRVLIHPGPGEKCPQCERRVPHERKPSSPRETHPLTFGRAPTDIVDELKERLSALAVDARLEPLPFYQARVVMMLLELGEAVDKDVLGRLAAGMSWGTGKDEE